MATSILNGVLCHLRRAALLRDGGMTDGELLDYFLERRDETAFEVLMRRHGPMVLGVCRRLLPNEQDAEDAFQATFLVLARKGGSIVPRESVGNWLYGVALRTALKARATTARRRVMERQVKVMPEHPTEPERIWHELRPLLDRALERLPDKYREPVVLCELEGRTRKDVARQLGIPEGTLSSRLATARKLLAKKLARRGLALPAGSLALMLAQDGASACVPASLIGSTLTAATLFAAGQSAAGVVSAPVASLIATSQGASFVKKLTLAAVLMFVAVGVGVALTGPTGEQPPANGPSLKKDCETEQQVKTDARRASPEGPPPLAAGIFAEEALEDLRGTWRFVDNRNGDDSKPEGSEPGSIVVIERGAFGEYFFQGKDGERDNNDPFFNLNPAKSPKEIDMTVTLRPPVAKPPQLFPPQVEGSTIGKRLRSGEPIFPKGVITVPGIYTLEKGQLYLCFPCNALEARRPERLVPLDNDCRLWLLGSV